MEINTNLGELVEVSEDALGHKLYNIYNKNISEQQIISMKCTVETRNTFGIIKASMKASILIVFYDRLP